MTGGKCPRGKCPRGECPGGNVRGGNTGGGGECPGGGESCHRVKQCQVKAELPVSLSCLANPVDSQSVEPIQPPPRPTIGRQWRHLIVVLIIKMQLGPTSKNLWLGMA